MPLRGEAPGQPTYEILQDLPGGKSRIILANHKIFGRRCVQKIVDLHGSSGTLAFQEPRLMDEANHPRMTPIGEVQFDPDRGGAVTFIMPFYEGLSVAIALESGHRFSLQEAVAVTRDALDALSYLHVSMGYVHRDMKPGNVLLPAQRDRGFLTDFGSAAKIEGDGLVPARLGTVMYLPPEARTKGRVGVAGDVYGVGLTLFELLNGPLDYTQLSGSDMESRLLAGRRAVPDRMLRGWEPQVPDRLRRLVRKAVHVDSARRFVTARDFLNDLSRVRMVDWARTSGAGLDGEWMGTWPPDVRVGRRTTYRVTSRILAAGPRKGLLRLEANYRRSGALGWRSAGVQEATVAPDDAIAVAQFFEDVAARAAQRRAVR
jgi:serine/threonine protein kinase